MHFIFDKVQKHAFLKINEDIFIVKKRDIDFDNKNCFYSKDFKVNI